MKKKWIDNIRVLATIAVIIIHVSAGFLYDYGSISNTNWWIGLIFAGSMRFCVPIFLMISGALLLSKQDTIDYFIKKRLKRVLLPFIFWTFIYILFDLTQKYQQGEPLIFLSNIKYLTLSMFFGVRGHLWYIYMILGIYLFIPIIQKWINNCNKIEIKFYLIFWIFTLFINWIIPSTSGENGYNFDKGIDLTYFSGFLGYVILGYYLSEIIDLKIKRIKFISIISIIFGLVITILGTFVVTYIHDEYSRNFIRYLTPNVFLVSTGVFLLFKNCTNFNAKIPLLSKILNLISKYSYGIYLSHIFVIELLDKFGVNRCFVNPIVGIFTTTILCLFLSFIVTITINKLPYGEYISG